MGARKRQLNGMQEWRRIQEIGSQLPLTLKIYQVESARSVDVGRFCRKRQARIRINPQKSRVECAGKRKLVRNWSKKALDTQRECGRIQPAQLERAGFARKGKSLKTEEATASPRKSAKQDGRGHSQEKTKAKFSAKMSDKCPWQARGKRVK
jgi:hypothetical protein